MGTIPAVQPKAASGTLTIPPAVQGAAIGLRAQGKSKRKIAAELGIHRETVSKILSAYQTDALSTSETVNKRLVPKALARIEQVLENDTDTARWTLEHTLFQPQSGDRYTIQGDMTMNTMTAMLPGPSSTPITTSSTEQASTGTQAAAKPPASSLELSIRPNFLETIDTAALEAELERRRRAVVVEAEVVSAP